MKGADYIAAMVFMFASTNLVIELGIVLVVLMGWQFAVSEFIGGIIMIVLLATVGGLWLRGRLVVQARERLQAGDNGPDHLHGAPATAEAERRPLSARLRSSAGWAESATYTMSDLTMVRRELIIGYTVAGFLAVLVPTSVWQAVFISGHGFWTSLENAVVGPFIAIVSFVCSIGNVPLAASLWKGGIAFGGVIAFIFADLITFPLLLIYRRYYGTRLMFRMLVTFWALMSTAGLATEAIFRAAGLVPTKRPASVAPEHFSWNYTTYLNIFFLVVFGVLYWIYRNRDGSGEGSATRRTRCAGCTWRSLMRRHRWSGPVSGGTSAPTGARSVTNASEKASARANLECTASHDLVELTVRRASLHPGWVGGCDSVARRGSGSISRSGPHP